MRQKIKERMQANDCYSFDRNREKLGHTMRETQRVLNEVIKLHVKNVVKDLILMKRQSIQQKMLMETVMAGEKIKYNYVRQNE